jgi:hypothetical protein
LHRRSFFSNEKFADTARTSSPRGLSGKNPTRGQVTRRPSQSSTIRAIQAQY